MANLGPFQWPSVTSVVNDAAVELGLISTDLDDPFASLDANILLLLRLLTRLGQRLVLAHPWPQFRKTATIATVQAQVLYDLPGDFFSLITATAWDQTTKFPVSGPISPSAWEAMIAFPITSTVGRVFRFSPYVSAGKVGNGATRQIEIYPAPGAKVETITFEYATRTWLDRVSGSAVLSNDAMDRVTVGSDRALFESQLLVTGLKLAFRREKGFDTTTAQADYDEALEAAKAADAPVPVLSLVPAAGAPMISARNIPETGYGS